ncbi:Maf family protein [Crenobacter cavernae]|uniref:dTTP/UTP pyrophosphatase n=1 Tax=Crenobacter cavernae TaxID=2290923 RepID=A0A345Y443_9NEIS|nr:Maf family protein [Crenobacter cavernae]AXK38695.1 septum formation inhibitor Maf [Crenobacter cavernae]
MSVPSLLYLASGSPRRRELLEQLGLELKRVPADIDETPREGETARDYALRLAIEKAAAGEAARIAQGLPAAPLLAADTTVTQDDELFGKPENAADARRMLEAFSGRSHRVITAVAVCDGDTVRTAVSDTEVWFKTLSAAEIDRYLESGEPFDKAGAYGIQGRAAVFVERIAGSYTGVVGLPVYETAQLLSGFGYRFP